jgi:uncharacterized protein
MPEYVMGHVRDRPSQQDLSQSPAGLRMRAFKYYVDRECKGCKHIRYCRGGCPYNAIAPTNGEIKGVDPHCLAYKRIFDEIAERFNQEMMGSMGLEMGLSAKPASQSKENRPAIMPLVRKLASNQ